jgi:hypothetical protein
VAFTSRSELAIWWAVLVVLTLSVYARAIVNVRPSRRQMVSLVGTPVVVARLAMVTLGGWRNRELAWERTRRNVEV